MIDKNRDFNRQLKEIILIDKDNEFNESRFEIIKFMIIKALIDFHPANGTNKNPFNYNDLNNAIKSLNKEADKWSGMRLN